MAIDLSQAPDYGTEDPSVVRGMGVKPEYAGMAGTTLDDLNTLMGTNAQTKASNLGT